MRIPSQNVGRFGPVFTESAPTCDEMGRRRYDIRSVGRMRRNRAFLTFRIGVTPRRSASPSASVREISCARAARSVCAHVLGSRYCHGQGGSGFSRSNARVWRLN